MEAIKIKGNQVFANYRKPMSYSFIDTYPLPPLSTVKGWFHYVIDAKEYIPVSMSIQGKSDFIVYDMQTLIKFDRKRSEKKQIIIEGFNKAFSQSPTYVANVYNIDLCIYLVAEKKYLEIFKENVFKKDFPSLGRYEDLFRVDEVSFVNLEEEFMNSYKLDYGIYLNSETAKKINLDGSRYNMSFKYEVIDGIRTFTDKRDVVYGDNHTIKRYTLLLDKSEIKPRMVDFIGDYNG